MWRGEGRNRQMTRKYTFEDVELGIISAKELIAMQTCRIGELERIINRAIPNLHEVIFELEESGTLE